MFKQHEKFWAFILLVVAIVGLAIVSTFLGAAITGSDKFNEAVQAVLTAKLRILELIAVGLIGIAGAAGQAIFRTSENADAMNDILRQTIEGLKHSRPDSTANNPVPQSVTAAADQVAEAAVETAAQIADRAESEGKK